MISQDVAIDSSLSSALSPEKNSLLSKETFLRLFIEQLKNQDPLNPMENYELTAQLAQFSSLEQLYNVNKNFEQFVKMNSKLAYFQGISLLGKNVEYEGDKIYYSGEGQVGIKFVLDDDARKVDVNIFDENDNLVRTIEVNDLTKGENSVSWDGSTFSGKLAEKGVYRYEVVAYSPSGDRIFYTPYGSGVVDNIRFDSDTEEALFRVNGDEVSIDKILSIGSGY